MKKVVLTVALALSSLFASAQLGVVTLEKNHKNIPIGFWYVVNGKGFENQIFFFDTDKNINVKLDALLRENGLDIELPKGKDEEGDNYWVIYNELGYITHIYLIKGKTNPGYSTITLVTK
jgi:hypothetical protein